MEKKKPLTDFKRKAKNIKKKKAINPDFI